MPEAKHIQKGNFFLGGHRYIWVHPAKVDAFKASGFILVTDANSADSTLNKYFNGRAYHGTLIVTKPDGIKVSEPRLLMMK